MTLNDYLTLIKWGSYASIGCFVLVLVMFYRLNEMIRREQRRDDWWREYFNDPRNGPMGHK